MSAGKHRYTGTRIRLQRFSDAKMFHGWVESFDGKSFYVNLPTDYPIAPGDEFLMQGASVGGAMTCRCRAVESSLIDASRIVSNPRSAAVQQIPQTRVTCRILGDIHLAVAKEEARYRIPDVVFVMFPGEDVAFSAMAVDGSESGIGAICQTAIPAGTDCPFAFPTEYGEVRGVLTSRYSRPVSKQAQLYRVGFFLKELDRINRSKWVKFLDNLR